MIELFSMVDKRMESEKKYKWFFYNKSFDWPGQASSTTRDEKITENFRPTYCMQYWEIFLIIFNRGMLVVFSWLTTHTCNLHTSMTTWLMILWRLPVHCCYSNVSCSRNEWKANKNLIYSNGMDNKSKMSRLFFFLFENGVKPLFHSCSTLLLYVFQLSGLMSNMFIFLVVRYSLKFVFQWIIFQVHTSFF